MNATITSTATSIASILLSFTFISGCQKESEESQSINKPNDLSTIAFAIIDNQPLTAAEVRDTVLVNARIAELAKRPIKAEKLTNWVNHTAQRITPSLVAAKLLEREAIQIGTRVSDADTDKEFAKYNKLTHLKATSLDELAVNFRELEPAFRKQFNRECLFSAYFRNRPEVEVSQDDLNHYFHSATNQLRLSQKINAETWRRGKSIYARLKAGEQWDVVAKETTEDSLLDESFADYWKDWTDSPLTSIDFDGVRTNLATMAVGEFSRPIETEEGLVIIKLLGLENDFYHCARILLRMADNVEIPSVEDAKQMLYKERLMNYQRNLLTRLRKNAKIEYPLGTNITFKIWDAPQTETKEKNKTRKAAIK